MVFLMIVASAEAHLQGLVDHVHIETILLLAAPSEKFIARCQLSVF